MRTYRDLFEQEFGGNPRLFDIAAEGLPLGVKTLSVAEAFALLNRGQGAANLEDSRTGALGEVELSLRREKTAAFIREEIKTLETLRELLINGNTMPSGAAAMTARLEGLLATADYLWAHFPECAGADSPHPPCTDLGFLKRVRTEIEPFLKAWEMALAELVRQ
jgi:hypothetical protein